MRTHEHLRNELSPFSNSSDNYIFKTASEKQNENKHKRFHLWYVIYYKIKQVFLNQLINQSIKQTRFFSQFKNIERTILF